MHACERACVVSAMYAAYALYVCMYVVIDQKVLVRSFNCESRAMLETLPKVFFRVRESNIFFRESFAKVGYYNHYM